MIPNSKMTVVVVWKDCCTDTPASLAVYWLGISVLSDKNNSACQMVAVCGALPFPKLHHKGVTCLLTRQTHPKGDPTGSPTSMPTSRPTEVAVIPNSEMTVVVV